MGYGIGDYGTWSRTACFWDDGRVYFGLWWGCRMREKRGLLGWDN